MSLKPNGAHNAWDYSTRKKSIPEIVEDIKSLKQNLEGAMENIKNQRRLSSIIKYEDLDAEKLCNELGDIASELTNLKKLEVDLSKPLEFLNENLKDIIGVTDQLSTNEDVSEETKKIKWIKKNINVLRGNIIVLRGNITRLRIMIQQPHQPANKQPHQPANKSSKGGLDFQKTVASSRFVDLPSLVQSNFFKEVKKMFEEDLVDASGDDNKEFEAMKMKLCLLCFAIFPEDAEIRGRLLKLWWIGEDLIPDCEVGKEYADKILSTFVQIGFIVPVKKEIRPDGKAKSFKMPPLIRASLIFLAKEFQFFNFDDEGNPSGLPSVRGSKRICLVKKAEDEGPNLHLPVQEEVLKRLETVFNVSEQYPDLRIPVDSFAKMKTLGVLCLGRWENSAKRQIEVENTDFLKFVMKMKKLKFLSLQGVSGITTLPSLGVNLRDLRILDLRACYNLEQLPKNLDFLRSLAYLDITECCFLDFMPKNLSSLSQLEVLKGFIISDKKKSCSLTELACGLKNLEKLSILVKKVDYEVDELKDELSQFHKLEKLKVRWGREALYEKKEGDSQQGSKGDGDKQRDAKSKKTKGEAFTNLKKLDLECYSLSGPPSWLGPKVLKNLKKLYIRGGNLQNLDKAAEEGEEKWKVEILRLRYLNNMKINWRQLQELFPDLRYFQRVKCPRITFCPCDVYGVWIKA